MTISIADERKSSIERMKAEHVAVCKGCYTCKPREFAAPASSTFAMTQAAADLPRGGTRAPAQPVDVAAATEAGAWLEAYSGTWDFMRTLQAELRAGKLRFTPRVIEVILNAKARDAQRAAERAAKASASMETALTVEPIELVEQGRRWYAVENEERKLTFLRITRNERGWTFVDQIIGGGYSDTGMAEPRARITPQGQYRGTFEALYRKAMADPEAAQLRYGQEIGRCGHCNRILTDESSRAAGIGPVCATKSGF